MRHLPTGNTFLQENDILIFRKNCLHANINLTREINFDFQISTLSSKREQRFYCLHLVKHLKWLLSVAQLKQLLAMF